MSKPKIGAIAPWFGGKRSLAPTISEELGKHSSYFEPFCGSMAVLLAKPVSSHENVNDLHGDLINLALTIQDHELGPALYRRLRRVFTAEEQYKISREHLKDPEQFKGPMPHLERAYHYFIFSWIGRNGTAGTANINCGFCRRWTPYGGHGGKRFKSAVESIPAWRRRIQNVTILRMDGFEFIEKIADVPRTAIYVDPPYLVKGASYVYDFDGDAHGRLANLLRRLSKARVVVSYYDDPRLDELYPGWTKRCVYRSKATSLQNKRGATRTIAPEVLLINGPSYTQGNAENSLWPVEVR